MVCTLMIFLQARAVRLAAGAMIALALAMPSGASAQQSFKTAEEAVETLMAAVRAGDGKALTTILGPGAEQVMSSGDAVQDENTRKLFLAAYDVKHSITPGGDKPATLLIGPDDYPFAIPIAKKNDGWMFDTAAGAREILARRIGRNELGAIQVAIGYHDAQYEYAAMMPPVDGMQVYAQRVASSPGKKDGLYWPTQAGEPPSPLGDAVAESTVRGYRVGSGAPFRGYYYKILTRQGPKAPGGAHDYIVQGKMIGGFALIAWPAEYGNSGIATFMINHDGVVYEKDLGRDTSKIAANASEFNPDNGWKKVTVDIAEKR